MELREYWAILRRRWWLPVGLALVAFVFSTVIALRGRRERMDMASRCSDWTRVRLATNRRFGRRRCRHRGRLSAVRLGR